MKRKVIVGLIVFFMVLVSTPIKAKEESVSLHSDYVYVYSLKDNRSLYEKNAKEKIYPSSMTKLMTILCALDYIEDLNEKVVISETLLAGLEETGASSAGFKVNDTPTYLDLLYGIMLSSGTDEAKVVALSLFGDEAIFVDKMNKKAKQMHLENTHFVNTSGLHNDDHYSSAYDMAMIVKEGLKNKIFKTIYCASSYTTTTGLVLSSAYENQVALLDKDASVIKGYKTGFTNEASLCSASYMMLENEPIIMISGQTHSDASYPYHIEDALTMADYIANHFERKTLAKKDDVIGKIAIAGEDDFKVKANHDISLLLEKGKDGEAVFEGFKQMETPLFIESYLGDFVVYVDGKEIYREEYFMPYTIEKQNGLLSSGQFAYFIFVIALLFMMTRKRSLPRK